MTTDKIEKMTIAIPYVKDEKFGLDVKDMNGKVVVDTVEPDSIAVQHLKLNDCILSLNGVKVKDKAHCQEIINKASSSTEVKEIKVELERIAQKPVEQAPIPDIFDMDFQSPKIAATKKNKPSSPIPQNIEYGLNFVDEDDLFGNPLEGLIFPTPPDVQAILKKCIPQIMADYKTHDLHAEPTSISLISPNAIKFDKEHVVDQHAIGSDVPASKSLSKVGNRSKPKK